MSGVDALPGTETLEFTCSEAREVTDHQIATMNDLDDKAMWTLRLIVLVLGLVMTGLSVAIRADLPMLGRFVNQFTGAGFFFLVVSATLSVVVYSSGKLTAGPGPDDIELLLHEGYERPEWQRLVLTGYRDWMRTNQTSIRRDATVLALCQTFLVVGMVSFFLGVVTYL